MPSDLLLSVKESSVRYTNVPIFENLSFNIHENAKIALVGKNGAGKSTLMNIITGIRELDTGERWERPGLSIGYLHQDITPKKGQRVFDFIFEEIKGEERESQQYKVDLICDALELDHHSMMTTLSGGQLRRAGLARALVEEPDILLLDEPTNHLDLHAIEWLEGYLKSYQGAILCISHDRAFLANITNKIFWLDRGNLKVAPRGFGYFDEWSEMLLEQEERELQNRKQIVGLEVEWMNRGVKARRKRNIRRLERVKEMRDQLKADESAYRRATAKIKISDNRHKEDEHNSKNVAEFHNVYKLFQDPESEQHTKILDKFSLKIRRGDRIGILGRNGSGKTSFLKLLTGQIEPDQGRIKRRKELEFSYFDQKRADLNPEDSLWKTLVPSGGDYLNVLGKQRHVCGYLKDFMFDPADARRAVSTLSGGQKNRLMLAKILADPKSCLILDEPTNDLDMETLDMLEEILINYDGTLLIVSHDRDFLDQTVTKILAFEGDAVVEQYIGGYSDYLEAKQKNDAPKPQKGKVEPPTNIKKESLPTPPTPKPQKLTYNDQRALKLLPKEIDELEKRVRALEIKLSDPDFYTNDADGFHATVKEHETLKSRLNDKEEEWLTLEEQRIQTETSAT